MANIIFNTEITKLLGIKTPVMSAPMAMACGGDLAGQVTLAGGFGFIPGFGEEDVFRAELEKGRGILQGGGYKATSTTSPDNNILSVGVGFLGWKLDEPDGKASQLLTVALEARVSAVWLSFGNNLEKWVAFVREFDSKRAEPHTTLIFILVNSLQDARVAVEDLKADVVVAQGNEAGGHGHGAAPPVAALVTEILHQYPRTAGTKCPPVLAAGGISTGAHIAAQLTLGASGVVVGTRFLLTPESTYKPAQKAALLDAHATSTVRTLAFDVVRGTLAWPAGVDGRGISTQTSRDYDAGVDVEKVKTQFREAAKESSKDGLITWSGTGVGVVDKIQSAGDVLRELHEETVKAIRTANDLLIPSSTDA
ncbi:2-nitropropane dioxygenase [Schizopora paradoxa]|uniref:2-nitropropane dioxygenase n=1 Tax=Schizopora paradoxa TaxID=27342 RepID=A0A0H2SBD9_9AGAM|nr:2-nitropropane dioxygenase [Schizopora paradoxa]